MKPYLDIKPGSHKSAKDGMCVMEAVAYFVGEKHSDKPSCTCPVIGSAMISFNDRFPFKDNAERTETLLPLIPVVVGTVGSDEDKIQRGFIAADFAVRVFFSMRLKIDGRDSEAAEVKNLPEIKDKASAIHARDFLRGKYAAYAADAAAAYAAAYAADADASLRVTFRTAIKIAFAEMIKKMAAVGSKKLDLTFEAKAEFEAACEMVCK